MRYIIPAAVLLVSACAAQATKESPPVAPICNGQAQCDLKWGVARAFILDHAGYKFQTYTNDFMETFNSTDTGLAAQVNRIPLGNNSYQFSVKFWCGNPFGCFPPVPKTLREFVDTVNAAGQAPQK